MDLIVYQMMQLQIMHMPDRNGAVEVLARPSVAQSYLAVARQRNAFPYLAVLSVFPQVVKHFRQKLLFIFCLELFPFQIDIIIGKIQSIHNIIFFCAVKYRRLNVEPERFCRKA